MWPVSRNIDRYDTTFDHHGLISNAGLLVTATLMVRLGLEDLVTRWVRTGAPNPGRKICTLIAAMLAGATHIDHVDIVRAGATQAVLPFKVMAPSTVGTFLRSFTFGFVRQLDAVASRLLGRAWELGAGPGDQDLVIDLDSTVCEVHGHTKQGAELLTIIDAAVAGGWTAGRACTVLGLDRQRAWRWHTRRQGGFALDDLVSGGNAIHGLLGWEETEILALFDEWSDTDRSHRKLAHRGSYEQRVWVSPSTVDRVLARHNMYLAGETRPPKTVKTPWPAWCDWQPNQLWCWDASQFERCTTSKYAYGIIDLVSRKWITVTLTPEPNAVSVRCAERGNMDERQ